MTLLLILLFSMEQDQAAGCQPDCTVNAANITTELLIDGNLSEPEWSRAEPAKGFRQYSPDEGEPASFETEVRILHDFSTLYIGARMHDPQPRRIWRTGGRRDEFTSADWFAVSFGTYNDGQTSFNFAVNAAGVRVEGMQVESGQLTVTDLNSTFVDEAFGFDPSWDAEWRARARVDSIGWTVEMAIPLSALEIANPRQPSWGVNFKRVIARRAELDEWALVRTRELNSGRMNYLGMLHLESRIAPATHRYATGFLNTFRFARDDSDHNLPALPLPGLEAGLAMAPGIFVQAAAIPDFFPENFREYREANRASDFGEFRFRRPLAAAQQLQKTQTVLGHSLFQNPLRVDDGYLAVAAAGLHGRLNSGLTFSAIGLLPTGFDNFNYGFATRLRQNVGKYSSIGLSTKRGPDGRIIPVDYRDNDAGQVVREEYAYRGAVSAIDLDLRLRNNTRRIRGQIVHSGKSYLDLYRGIHRAQNDTLILLTESSQRSVRHSSNGYAARFGFEQLQRSWNWFGRVEITGTNFSIDPYLRIPISDRIVFSAGVSHEIRGAKQLIRKGNAAADVRQWLSYSNAKSVESSVSVNADLLTRWFNQVSLGLGVGQSESFGTRASFDFASSTDVRKRIVVTPKIETTMLDGEILRWNVSGKVRWLRKSRYVFSSEYGIGAIRQIPLASEVFEGAVAAQPIVPAADASRSINQASSTLMRVDYQADPWLHHLAMNGATGSEFERARIWFYAANGIMPMSSSLDTEVGVAAYGIQYREGIDHSAGSSDIQDAEIRLDWHVGIRWEYDENSTISLGSYLSMTNNSSLSQRTINAGQLFNNSSSWAGERYIQFRVTRKIWR